MGSEQSDDIGSIAAFGVAALVFTLGGLYIEQASLQALLSGQQTVGYWEFYMGAIALLAGVYLFGYREWWPRMQAYRRP